MVEIKCKPLFPRDERLPSFLQISQQRFPRKQ